MCENCWDVHEENVPRAGKSYPAQKTLMHETFSLSLCVPVCLCKNSHFASIVKGRRDERKKETLNKG